MKNNNPKIKMENGKWYRPKDSDEIRCEDHGTVTTYGELDWLQRLALESGLDSTDSCLLAKENRIA